uniref:Chloride channel protein n=1 Tax=Plectus sambesii TaxID=2011161 RepID=A0A914VQ98_9BILA
MLLKKKKKEGESNTEPVAPATTDPFEKFRSIDWLREWTRDRQREKHFAKRHKSPVIRKLHKLWGTNSGWICVFMVGLSIGALGGLITLGTRYMSDLKNGVCLDRFWLDQQLCCRWQNDTLYVTDTCDEWKTWPEVLGIGASKNQSFWDYTVEFLFFCIIAAFLTTWAALLVYMFAPYASGSGIPEVKCILSGAILRGYLGKMTLFVKTISLTLVAASVLSLGKEGPLVHLASCLGNIYADLFPKYGRNEAKKREILSASAAAGVAAAFGAPVGGVLFSLEEASYYFSVKTMARSFFSALIASVVVRLANPFGTYQTPLFFVDYRMSWSFLEMIPFILLGIFGALIGCLFIVANLKWCKVRKTTRLGKHPVIEVLVVTIFMAAIAYHNPYTRKATSALIQELFDRCNYGGQQTDLCNYVNITSDSGEPLLTADNYGHTGGLGPNLKSALWKLALALVCKLIFTVFTFGMKIPAGLFIPSIAMGSIAGRLMGIGMEQLVLTWQGNSPWLKEHCQVGVDCVMPGLYALIGAAAVLVGVTRMTVSLVVIMFELTGSLEFVVPAMVTVLITNWLGAYIYERGIYDAHIHQNGYPFLDGREKFESTTPVKAVMNPRPGGVPLRVVSQDTVTLGDIEQMLKDTHYNGYPVVDNEIDNNLIGFVERTDLKLLLNYYAHNGEIGKGHHSSQSTVRSNSLSAASIESALNDLTVYSAFSNATTTNASNSRGQLGEKTASLHIPKKLMDTTPLSIDGEMPMEKVVDMFIKLGGRHILVTKKGRLLGLITRKDATRYVREVEEQGSDDEHESEEIELIGEPKPNEVNNGGIEYIRL